MKNFLFTLLTFSSLLFASCSSDDSNDSSVNTTEYSKITINGTTYNNTEPTIIEYGANSCSNPELNSDLRASYIGEFYNSTFDIGLYFAHSEFTSDFQGFDISQTELKYADLIYGTECYNNLDVMLDYYDVANDEDLVLDSSFNNISTIQSCTQIAEDSTEVTYLVKGTFSCRFKRIDNSTVTITGEYNRKIFIVK